MKFSIIVPVYNVEKYLVECVNSILQQDYSDYEILLIDDGSTDRSGVLCDEMRLLDNRIKVFHKKNGGLSDARNFGIENAEGDYIVFVDSDDWIEKDSLLSFYNAIKNGYPEVVVTRLADVKDGVVTKKDEAFSDYLLHPLTKDRAIKWIICESEDTWPAVKLIVSKQFIIKNNIRFAVGRLHEDEDWTRKVCCFASHYSGVCNVWYYHRLDRPNSITNKIGAKNITDVIEMADVFLKYCENNNFKEKELLINRTMASIYNSINRIDECTVEDIDIVAECIKENRYLFRIMPSTKYKIFGFAMKIFGPKKALKLLATYNRLKKRQRIKLVSQSSKLPEY